MKHNLDIQYFENVVDCWLEAALRLQRAGAVLENSEWQQDISAVNYGDTRRWSYAIASLKGKPTKKWFHFAIYRLDSGRYELTAYIL